MDFSLSDEQSGLKETLIKRVVPVNEFAERIFERCLFFGERKVHAYSPNTNCVMMLR